MAGAAGCVIASCGSAVAASRARPNPFFPASGTNHPLCRKAQAGEDVLLLNDPVRAWVLPGATGNGWVTRLSCQPKEQAPSSPR